MNRMGVPGANTGYTVRTSDKEYASREMEKWRYWRDCRRAERMGEAPPDPSDYDMLQNPKSDRHWVEIECSGGCGDTVRKTKHSLRKMKRDGAGVYCADCLREKKLAGGHCWRWGDVA